MLHFRGLARGSASSGLSELSGLEGPASADSLTIGGNPYLSRLSSPAGLRNLRTLEEMYVADNPNLPACAVTELEAQTGTMCDPSCNNSTGVGGCSH